MATKIGTISISAITTPTCSWTFPTSVTQDTNTNVSVKITNNHSSNLYFGIMFDIKDSGSNVTYNYKSTTVNLVQPGRSGTISLPFKITDSGNNCYTSWKIENAKIWAEYQGTNYGTFCSQSSQTFTLLPKYKGGLGTGHTIPSSAYLGETPNFTIKGKNTNNCFTYDLWAKVTLKLSTDETVTIEGSEGSKVSTTPGSTSDLSASVDIPTTATGGTYNVYAELYAG